MVTKRVGPPEPNNSSDIALTQSMLTAAATGVVPGTYASPSSFTVGADGRITVVSGSAGGGNVIPDDVSIPALAVATAYVPSPYPSVLQSYTDTAGNNLLRLTETSHVTTLNGYNANNVPATHMGLNYVYRCPETVNNQYITVQMIMKTGGSSFTWQWDVLDANTKAVVGTVTGQSDGILSNNPATPLRRYYIGYNGGALNQLCYDNLPTGTGTTVVATYSSYNNVLTMGERRQSDGASEKIALVAVRNDATGVDVLVVDLASGSITKTIPFTGWSTTSGANIIRAAAINHDATKVIVLISDSNGSLAPVPYSGVFFGAFFDVSGSPTYTGRTPNHSSNHGDWVVKTDGSSGWCSAWMGQYNSGTGVWDDVYGTVGASAAFIAWFPHTYNPTSNANAPTVLLDAASTGAACYCSGMVPGRVLLSWGDFSVYGGDETSKMYLRVIDLKADGSMYGSVRAIQQCVPSSTPYEGICRSTFGRDRKTVYTNLGSDLAANVYMYLSTRPGAGGSGGSFLPEQAGNAGKYLTTNGATPSWATVSGGGGGDAYLANNQTFSGQNTFSNQFKLTGAESNYVGVAGTTKGVRIQTDANATYLTGVDNTFAASYQPLAIRGSVVIFSYGGFNEGFRLDGSGNILFGTSGTVGTGAAKVLAIGNGTAPSSNISGVQLYSDTGVLKYRNGAGTTITLDGSASGVIGIDGIDPDTQAGATDRDKFIAACNAAVAAGKPVVLKRIFRIQRVEFTQAHDGLHILGFGPSTGLKMVDVPNGADIAWGWMLHVNPTGGTSMTITFENFLVDGNRGAAGVINQLTTSPTTEWAIVPDGGGYSGNPTVSRPTVILKDLLVQNWDMSGCVQIGDGAITRMDGCKFRFMGGSGMDFTRGYCYLNNFESSYNAGIGCNTSAAYESHVTNAHIHHNGMKHPSNLAYKGIVPTEVVGGGMKISLRTDGSNPRVMAYLDNVLIEDNASQGLTSTSAGAMGTITGGTVILRRNGAGSINLTDNASIYIEHLICEEGLKRYTTELMTGYTQAAINGDSTDILIFGSGRAHFGRVYCRGSLGHGINGGWGTNFNARTVMIEDSEAATHKPIRWVGGGTTGFRVDEITLKGTNGALEWSLTAPNPVIGATYTV